MKLIVIPVQWPDLETVIPLTSGLWGSSSNELSQERKRRAKAVAAFPICHVVFFSLMEVKLHTRFVGKKKKWHKKRFITSVQAWILVLLCYSLRATSEPYWSQITRSHHEIVKLKHKAGESEVRYRSSRLRFFILPLGQNKWWMGLSRFCFLRPATYRLNCFGYGGIKYQKGNLGQ